MRHICHDCGNEIPEGMDFCPKCGCMADKATLVDDSGFPLNICPNCGASIGQMDRFCGACGVKLSAPVSLPAQAPLRMRKNGMLAVILALVPGFFNIFGLGHFLMKEWSRGFMFLAISVIIWFLNGWSFTSDSFFVMILSVAVFFFQASDVIRIIYKPEGR